MRQDSLFTHCFLLTCVLFCMSQPSMSQKIDRDKVSADRTLYELLTSNHVVAAQPFSPVIDEKMVEKTNEKDVFLVKGNFYQIQSLRSDYYVSKTTGQYKVIFDGKYPMESFVNLMLNKTAFDKNLEVVQHMYGEKRRIDSISVSAIHDLLGGTMKAYFSVTSIENGKMKAILVFHHEKLDFIHLFEMETTVGQLFSPSEKIKADLFGNIPQSNLKNLFKFNKR